MEGLVSLYQLLRMQPLVPFCIAVLIALPLIVQLKTSGRASTSLWLYFGGCSLLWLAFAIFAITFHQEPLVFLNEFIVVGLPLFVLSVNAMLFWGFESLRHRDKQGS
jgi:hypothetical protein